MRIIDRERAEHYTWKRVCDGWHFIDSEELSVIAEKMPPHTAEDMHYHRKARQFFYILSGVAEMRLENKRVKLESGTGIEIEPAEAHQMTNSSDDDVEFIVVSMPKSHGDRVLTAMSGENCQETVF